MASGCASPRFGSAGIVSLATSMGFDVVSSGSADSVSSALVLLTSRGSFSSSFSASVSAFWCSFSWNVNASDRLTARNVFGSLTLQEQI